MYSDLLLRVCICFLQLPRLLIRMYNYIEFIVEFYRTVYKNRTSPKYKIIVNLFLFSTHLFIYNVLLYYKI